MSSNKNAAGKQAIEERRKRIERLKKIIITIFIVCLLLPSIFCTALFVKLARMEKRLDTMEAVYLKDKELIESNSEEKIAQAAPKVTLPTTSNVEKTKEVELTIQAEATEKPENSIQDQTKIKGKKVYLTFDDGPSKNTEIILDILKKNNVKATFFVIGHTDEFSKKMYKRIYEEGHTLAMHSYTHVYQTIYKSLGNYKKDISKLSNLLFEITGEKPKFLRFPGGSSNTVSSIDMKDVIKYVDSEGLSYFDWNVINGDATGKKLTEKQMVSNVMEGVEAYENSTVLMHDCAGKEMTVKTLPTILKKLKKKKVSILPINETTVPVQHIHVDKVVKKK